jgi:SAM-dependent methyltransferase
MYMNLETMSVGKELNYRRCATLEEAAAHLGEIIQKQGGGDGNYFKGERKRYLYSIARVLEICPPPCRVLDIGSHYLHQAVLLSLLGYDVVGLDVPFFTERNFIRERANVMKIENLSTERHQFGDYLAGLDETFDLVICTAFLEHIAFNPVAFWRRTWQLLVDDGVIYITTPNAFRVRALAKAVGRMLTLEGIGLPVGEVLSVITSGHHWKEYSCREIMKYFHELSPDFTVETKTYGDHENDRRLISKICEILPPFRTNIEAVVRVKGKTKFASPPTVPMQANSES